MRVSLAARRSRSGGPPAPALTCREVEVDCGHESRHRLLREVYDAASRGDFDALPEPLHPELVARLEVFPQREDALRMHGPG